MAARRRKKQQGVPKKTSAPPCDSGERCPTWIDAAPCLPDQTTKRDPKAYRACLIERANDVKKPRADRRPVAILTMGGPASGKSSIVGKLTKARDLVRSDPDDVKEQIPEYALAVARCAKNAAFMAHEESAEIAEGIAVRAVKERKNLVIDGTGKNLEHYLKTIKNLRKAGYHVTVLGASIPVDVALKRAEVRGGQTGRFVPPHIIRDIYTKVPCNIRPIAQAADDFVLFDTLSKDPRPVMTKERGEVKILDEGYVSHLEKQCAMPLSGTLKGAVSGPARSSKQPAVALADLIVRARGQRRK